MERERKEHRHSVLKTQAKREALVKKMAHVGSGSAPTNKGPGPLSVAVAVAHYCKTLLIRCGLSPWVQYVSLLR